MGSTQITVHNSAELNAALKAATGGETILMENTGSSYSLSIYKWFTPESDVTIQSADSDNPVSFDTLSMQYAKNLTIDNIILDQTSLDLPSYRQGLNISGSENIAVKNSEFIGGAEGELGVSDGSLKGNQGVSVSNSQNILIENNSFDGNYTAVNIHEADNVTLSDNEIKNFQQDGVRISGNKDLLIENNHIHDPLGARNDITHNDLIQMWAVNESRASENITIRGNILDSGYGSFTQSIFMRNEDVDRGLEGEDRYYKNIVVEDNLIHNSHTHGISLGESDGVLIQNNTLLFNSQVNGQSHSAGEESYSGSHPTIKVNTASKNVTIQNNVTSNVTAPEDTALNNNLIVDYDEPHKANYIDKLFINASQGGSDGIAGFMVLEGSLADENNLGSHFTAFNPSPDVLTAVYTVKSVDGQEDTFVFDAGLSANKNGLVEDDATYTWTFADGTKVEGRIVEHTFDSVGRHNVQLQVTTNNEIDTFCGSVMVKDPLLLDINFDSGDATTDTSSYDTKFSFNNEALTESKEGLAFELNGDNAIKMNRGEKHLSVLDQFSVSFDFQKANTAGADGQIFGVYKSLSLSVTENDALLFSMHDAVGNKIVLETSDGLVDSQMHSFALSYDSIGNEVQIYMDDVVVASGEAGLQTKPEESWSLLFGGYSWQNSAEGQIDNILMTTDPYQVNTNDADNIDSGVDDTPVENDANILAGTNSDDTFSYAVDYEEAYGYDGNDYISGADKIHGGNGDDKLHTKSNAAGHLEGDNGNDVLIGYAGNDILRGGQGADKMKGAEGDDILYIDNDDTWIQGGSGYDKAIVEGEGLFTFEGKFFHHVEELNMDNGKANILEMDIYDVRSAVDDTLIVLADQFDTINLDLGQYTDVSQNTVQIDGQAFNHFKATQGTWLDADLYISAEANIEIM